MQIHGPNSEADPATFSVYLNPGNDRPFASVQMGHVGFFAVTPEECDAAIRVWTEAKQLLLAGTGQVTPVNHKTPAEERLAAQLAAAPAVLRRVHVHLFGQDGICTVCDTDIVTWSQAQGDAGQGRIAIEGTLS